MKKLRPFLQQALADQLPDNETEETLDQLERILEIRRNRQQKLESKTRELKRKLQDKEQQLEEQKQSAEQSKANSASEIQAIRQMNNSPQSVNDIFFWKQKEVDINKNIKKLFAQCDEIQSEKNMQLYRLNEHLKVYRQATIDAEKIELIKDEVQNEAPAI